MNYKTRKTNKKSYLHKRKSKRMYGGDPTNMIPEDAVPTNAVPTITSNIVNTGKLLSSVATNLAAQGIQSAAEAVGVDPNKSVQDNINEIGDKVANINTALDSPEGQQLKAETSELLANSIDILDPSIKKAENIANDALLKLSDTGTGILVTAANELPPIFLMNELSKFGTAAAQAGEGIAELTTTGTQALKNLEEQKRKAETIWEKGKTLVNNITTGVNETVSNGISELQKKVDSNSYVDSNNRLGLAGGSLKKIHKDALMIGGRVSKSHLEFISPHVNRKHLLGKYRNTKRHYNSKIRETRRR
jgi:hypothetical protein